MQHPAAETGILTNITLALSSLLKTMSVFLGALSRNVCGSLHLFAPVNKLGATIWTKAIGVLSCLK